MQTPIGIGLIGVGRHGSRYARHIIQDIAEAVLVAACRRHPDRPLDLPGSDAVRIYGDPLELIGDPAVQVVVAVVPPVFNREIGLQAIGARKPILIEKPLAASYADAQILASAADKAGVPLMTAQTLRFDPIVHRLKECLSFIGRTQQISLVSHIETKGRDADHAEGYGKRGALLEFGVHMLDLIRFVTGEEVREVRCTMEPRPSVAPDTAASVELTTSGETRCRVDVSRVPTGRVGQAEWSGSKGRLAADWIDRRLQLTQGTDRTEDRLIPPIPTVSAALAAFLHAVANRTPMPVTGQDGCRAVEIAEACYRSAAAGGATVRLPLDG